MSKITAIALATALLGFTTLHAAAADADGLDRRFYITNNSNRTILSVRASNIDERRYEPFDLLGDSMVLPGYSQKVRPAHTNGYCRFDIRIEFADGTLQEIRNVNVCRAEEVVTYGYGRRGFTHRVIYSALVR